MKRPVKTAFFVLWLLGLSLNGFSQTAPAKSPWLHLEVKEKKGELELVKVNVPLSLLETALEVVKDKHLQGGQLKLHSHDFSVAEIRQLWEEVKKAGNAEFVTVQKATETVRVAREGNFLLVCVNEGAKKTSKVDLKVPLPVVDALFSGAPDELNIKAALMALPKNATGEILTVHDNNTQVRLWLD